MNALAARAEETTVRLTTTTINTTSYISSFLDIFFFFFLPHQRPLLLLVQMASTTDRPTKEKKKPSGWRPAIFLSLLLFRPLFNCDISLFLVAVAAPSFPVSGYFPSLSPIKSAFHPLCLRRRKSISVRVQLCTEGPVNVFLSLLLFTVTDQTSPLSFLMGKMPNIHLQTTNTTQIGLVQ